MREQHRRMCLQPLPTRWNLSRPASLVHLRMSRWLHWHQLWNERWRLCHKSVQERRLLHRPSEQLQVRLWTTLHRYKLPGKTRSMLTEPLSTQCQMYTKFELFGLCVYLQWWIYGEVLWTGCGWVQGVGALQEWGYLQEYEWIVPLCLCTWLRGEGLYHQHWWLCLT